MPRAPVRKRRQPILPHRPRRQAGPLERLIGYGLLLLLAGGAWWFVLAGRGEGPPSLQVSAAPELPSTMPRTSPGGWPRGDVEQFDADTMYEKINGKADAYIALDVVGLEVASYAHPEDDSLYVDLYIYDMAEPLNAYGIYRAQRGDGERALTLGEEGSRSGGAIFVRKGALYVEIVGSGPKAEQEALALAEAVVAALPAGKAPAVDPPWFPEEGRTMIGYARRNALGVESLTDAFLALYEDGLQVAVARCASAQVAEAASAEAQENFAFLGTPALFAAMGDRVIGVVGSDDGKRRTAMLAEVRRRLEANP